MKTQPDKSPKKTIKSAKSKAYPAFDEKVSSIVSEPFALYVPSSLERLSAIRTGIPYAALETISQKLNQPVKAILELFNIPQTTYNKKKSEQALLGTRDSEIIILLNELLDYGNQVFNHEQAKFQRWLKKPNAALAGHTPESMLDTSTGIAEVRLCLDKIEYGNFA
jgi:putative toxin-antitoxin system antitoxin component (TIGR02293 family)